MATNRKTKGGNSAVGKRQPPKASRRKKGQSGSPKVSACRPPSQAERILWEFRRKSQLKEDGKAATKTNFEIIYQQLLAKESKGDRAAGRARDRYDKFACSNRTSASFLLRHVQSESTREFADELKRQQEETTPAAEEEGPEASTS